MPELYIITGSNGAGKSSVGPDYIPEALRSTIFDGDKLFMQKKSDYWNSGIRSYKECRKLAFADVENTFDALVESALQQQVDWAYEGHFTNDATWDIPKKFKEASYKIHLLFFGLTDTALSETRVVARSQEGGHYVDPMTISDNFYGNLEKMDQYFVIFDTVTIIDTSEIEHTGLAMLQNGQSFSSVSSTLLPLWFTDNLPKITAKVIAGNKPIL
ncbi:MAG: zeta toxin family protein [Rhizobacter sp.]|nr:zeta toxin family protein [Ferruginibacter sp.]